jgi:hypothetical protein
MMAELATSYMDPIHHPLDFTDLGFGTCNKEETLKKQRKNRKFLLGELDVMQKTVSRNLTRDVERWKVKTLKLHGLLSERRQVRGRFGLVSRRVVDVESPSCCCFFLCLVGFVCCWLVKLAFCDLIELRY